MSPRVPSRRQAHGVLLLIAGMFGALLFAFAWAFAELGRLLVAQQAGIF